MLSFIKKKIASIFERRARDADAVTGEAPAPQQEGVEPGGDADLAAVRTGVAAADAKLPPAADAEGHNKTGGAGNGRAAQVKQTAGEVATVAGGRSDGAGSERRAQQVLGGEAIPADALGALLSCILQTLEALRPKPEPPKKPTVAERFASARTVAVSTFTILALTFLAAALVYEGFREDAVQIASFEVPEDLAKRGYTSYSLASALANHLSGISRDAQVLEMGAHRFTASSQETTPDIEVPQANISLRSIIGYVKGFVRPATRIDGEIIVVQEEPDRPRTVTLNLRIFSGKSGETGFVSKTGDEQNLTVMIEEGAADIYSYVEPAQLAVYFYNKIQNNADNKNRAVELIRHCLQNDRPEDDYWAYALLSAIRAGEGDHREAEQLARKAINLRPELGEAYHQLAYAYEVRAGQSELSSGDRAASMSKAVENYEKALALNPKFGGTAYTIGLIFFRGNDYERAGSYFRKSISIWNAWDEPHASLGRVLDVQGRYDEAVSEFKTALLLNPNSTLALTSWGEAAQKRSEYETALDKYLSAIRLRDSSAEVKYQSVVYELNEKGRADEAADAYTKWGEVLVERMRELAGEMNQAAERGNYPEASAKYDSVKHVYMEAFDKYTSALMLKANLWRLSAAAHKRSELIKEVQGIKRPAPEAGGKQMSRPK
jgi:tetratricopeptide (TPR) repeat protein